MLISSENGTVLLVSNSILVPRAERRGFADGDRIERIDRIAQNNI